MPDGWRPEIAGVYRLRQSDGAGPCRAAGVARFPGAERLRYGIRTDRPEALARALTRGLRPAPENGRRPGELKAFSLQVFERTFVVTGALNVLTLAIAGFAILTSLLTLAAMRQPQLAPVWALGLTRARLRGSKWRGRCCWPP
jgi:putative ABC transport system permease protein